MTKILYILSIVSQHLQLCLAMLLLSLCVCANAKVVIWSEDWTGATSGQLVGDYKAMYSGSPANGVKIYSSVLAGGKSPELILNYQSTWTVKITDLKGVSGTFNLTFKTNAYTLSSLTANGTEVAGNHKSKDKLKTCTFTVDKGTTELTLVFSTSGDNIRIDDIELYVDQTLTAVSFGEDYDGKTFYFTEGVNESFIKPQHKVTPENVSGSVTYASSDTRVVEVDSGDGTLTFKGYGQSGITATFTPDDNTYATSSATYTVVNRERDKFKPVIAFEDGTPHGSVFQVRRDEIFTGKRAVCNEANATGSIVYGSSNESVVRVDDDGQLTFVAYGSSEVSAFFQGTGEYTNSDTIVYRIVYVDSHIFYESFDKCGGPEGNDGVWATTGGKAPTQIYDKDLDNSGWTYDCAYAACKCVKLGLSAQKGRLVSPQIDLMASDSGILRFKAGAYKISGETNKMTVSVDYGTLTYNGTSGKSIKLELKNGEWTEYVMKTQGARQFKITFSATQTTANRIYIDEVMVDLAQPCMRFEQASVDVKKGEATPAMPQLRLYDSEGRDSTIAEAEASGVTVTYSSDNSDVATVENSILHVHSIGTAVISAVCHDSENKEYDGLTASFRLNSLYNPNYKYTIDEFVADFNAGNVPAAAEVTLSLDCAEVLHAHHYAENEVSVADVFLRQNGRAVRIAKVPITEPTPEGDNLLVSGVVNGTLATADGSYGIDYGGSTDLTYTLADTKIVPSLIDETADINAYSYNLVSLKGMKVSAESGVTTLTDGTHSLTLSSVFCGDGVVDLHDGETVDLDAILLPTESFMQICPLSSAGVVYCYDEGNANSLFSREDVTVRISRTLVADNWNSFCVPFDLTYQQACEAFGDNAQIQTLDPVNTTHERLVFKSDDRIRAGMPYIIRPTVTGSGTYTFHGVTVSDADPTTIGSVCRMAGIYSPTEVSDVLAENPSAYVAFIAKGDKLVISQPGTMKGFRAYFLIPQEASPMVSIGELTGVNAAHSDSETQDGFIYDLSGRRVGRDLQSPRRGVYVYKGKKIMTGRGK